MSSDKGFCCILHILSMLNEALLPRYPIIPDQAARFDVFFGFWFSLSKAIIDEKLS